MTPEAIWLRLQAAAPAPVAECVFRVTEGFNLPTVLAHGTDRHGRDRAMDWVRRGYRGRPRPFDQVIYGSTAEQVELSLTGSGSSALVKVAVTPSPHLLVYARAALEPVREKEWAFRGPPRAALLAVFSVSPWARLA